MGEEDISSHFASVTTINVNNLEHLVKPKASGKKSPLPDTKKLKRKSQSLLALGTGTCMQWLPSNVHLPLQGEGGYMHSRTKEPLRGIPMTSLSEQFSLETLT